MKVLVLDQNPDDACSWYRCGGPWSVLAKQGVQVEFGDEPTWQQIRGFNCVFISRPHRERDLQAIKAAQWHGVKVWIDYDDNLFKLPPENPARLVFARPTTTLIMSRAINSADIITVSTEPLRKTIAGFVQKPEKVRVIPNALDEAFANSRQLTKKGAEKVVLWRGSSTHQADLQQFSEQIVKAGLKFPKTKWMFMGTEPWFTEAMPPGSVQVMPPQPLNKYFDILASLHADIGIVPLKKSDFNSCKSDIAAMELSFAGAECLVPAAWDIPGTRGYSNEQEFGDTLEQMLGGETRGGMAAMQHFWTRSLNIVNQKRLEILGELTSQ